MRKRLAKKIIKASGSPKTKTFHKTMYVFDNEFKTFRRMHKVWHTQYLPYSDEQIKTARRTFKSEAEKYKGYYLSHGAIFMSPMELVTIGTIDCGNIPTNTVNTRYAQVEVNKNYYGKFGC